jgi:ribosomal protein S21
MDERIPTIFDEEALPSSRGLNIAPSTELILAVAKRAHSSYDYQRALKKNGISIDQVQHPIADALHLKYLRKDIHKETKSAREYEKTTVRRWNEKTDNRDRQLKQLTKSAHRKLLAKETSTRLQEDTKDPPYYPDLLEELAHIFASTTKPRRLIAATLLLFNLSSQMPCDKCKHIGRSRGPKPKKLTAAFDVTRGNNLCNKKRLFECPNFPKIEDKVRKMMKRLDLS